VRRLPALFSVSETMSSVIDRLAFQCFYKGNVLIATRGGINRVEG
jgi:hypothetical protein